MAQQRSTVSRARCFAPCVFEPTRRRHARGDAIASRRKSKRAHCQIAGPKETVWTWKKDHAESTATRDTKTRIKSRGGKKQKEKNCAFMVYSPAAAIRRSKVAWWRGGPWKRKKKEKAFKRGAVCSAAVCSFSLMSGDATSSLFRGHPRSLGFRTKTSQKPEETEDIREASHEDFSVFLSRAAGCLLHCFLFFSAPGVVYPDESFGVEAA